MKKIASAFYGNPEGFINYIRKMGWLYAGIDKNGSYHKFSGLYYYAIKNLDKYKKILPLCSDFKLASNCQQIPPNQALQQDTCYYLVINHTNQSRKKEEQVFDLWLTVYSKGSKIGIDTPVHCLSLQLGCSIHTEWVIKILTAKCKVDYTKHVTKPESTSAIQVFEIVEKDSDTLQVKIKGANNFRTSELRLYIEHVLNSNEPEH